MNRKRYIVLSISIIVISIFCGYNLYVVSPRTFLDQEKTFIYANESLNEKNIDDLIDEIEKISNNMNIKLDKENINKLLKNIKNLYVVSEDSFITSKMEFVTIIDPGYRYIFYLLEIDDYFDEVGEYYSLKYSIKEKLNLKKYGIDAIYMTHHKGNFILSTDINELKKVEYRNTYSNKWTIKNLNENIDKNLGVLILNFEKEKIYDFRSLVIGTEYKDKKLYQNIFLETIPGTSFINAEIKNRSLEKYIDNNVLYIANSDYNQLNNFVLKIVKRDKSLQLVLNLWQGVLGVKLNDLINDIDEEMIFNYEKNSGLIKLKKNDNFQKILPEIKNYLKVPIKIKNNMIYIGEEELQVNNKNEYKLKKNQFLYLDKNSENLIVEGIAIKNGLFFHLEIKGTMLKKYFKKLILGGRENDKDI